MQDFYKDLALRSPRIFLRYLVRTDTTFDILSKLIFALFVGSSNPVVSTGVGFWNWLTGSEVVLNGVPFWWSLVLLGIVFLHGLFRYVHEDRQKIEQERDDLKEKLKTYENRDAQKVVARVEKKGPVASSNNEYGIAHVHVMVPYAPHDNPTAIRIESAEDVYLVTLSYEVRKLRSSHELSSSYPTIQTATSMRVLDEDGNEVRDLKDAIDIGTASVHRNGFWRYVVSCGTILSDLPKGVYRLKVYDYTDGAGNREYRNMSLTVTKLGKSAALPVPGQ